MKADNTLTSEFITKHPEESARVLEKLPPAHVAEFLLELALPKAASLITAMLPLKTAACCEYMTVKQAGSFISIIPAVTAASILRSLTKARRDEIVVGLPEKRWREIARRLKFSTSSVGSIITSRVDSLPQGITVAEAVKRVANFSSEAGCEIYVTDDSNRLVGSVDAGRLLKASQHAQLSSVMNKKVQQLSALTDVATLSSHPAWLKYRRLPVVDRDKTFVGVLDYSVLQETGLDEDIDVQPRPLENMMSLGVFYWIHAAQLLVGMFSVVTRGQEEKS